MSDNVVNRIRTHFSKDSLNWLRIIIVLQLSFLCGLVFLLYQQFTTEPQPVYFPLKKGDQLIENVPLYEAILTDAELLNWVTEAMIVSFSFNYHNYNKILEKAEDYFDDIGMKSYKKIINSNPSINKVLPNKLILSGRPTAAPRVLNSGVLDGRYVWEIELPFMWRLRNQKTDSMNELKITAVIVRVPEQVVPLGVKIVKLDVVPMNTI